MRSVRRKTLFLLEIPLLVAAVHAKAKGALAGEEGSMGGPLGGSLGELVGNSYAVWF